jgi:hypothetical protein
MAMKTFPLAVAAFLTASLGSAQALEIDVYPWLAPNAYGSPSFAGAAANAVTAMENNLTSYGTPGTPTYFQVQPNVTSAQAIVTGFPSWLGQSTPGSVYGPAFADELGNRLTWAVRIEGLGQQFSIAQLSFTTQSSDVGNGLGWNWATGSYNYSSQWVGALLNSDGSVKSLITSGPNTQMVDALFSRGSGNSYAAYCAGCSPEDQQKALLAAAADSGSYKVTGTYTLTNLETGSALASGSAMFNVSETPLPAALPLFSGGLGLVALLARRRKARDPRLVAA